jgi:DnaJ-class molecular chaperone
MTTAKTYYDILGVSPLASVDEIREAAQRKANAINASFNALSDDEKRRVHQEIQAQADEIKTALQVLSDPAQRQTYDVQMQGSQVLEHDIIEIAEEKEQFITLPGIIAMVFALSLLYFIFIGDEYLSALIAIFL